MRYAPRWILHARRSLGSLVIASALCIAWGGGDPATPEAAAAAEAGSLDADPAGHTGIVAARSETGAWDPFDGPQPLTPLPPSLPYLYDRVVADDDHVLVGVPTEPGDDAYAGSVIVHVRGEAGSWTRGPVIHPPSDDGPVDSFGEHLALDGATLGITANRRDPASGTREAVVYLFESTDAAEWRRTGVLFQGEGVQPGSLTMELRGGVLAVGHRPSFAGGGPGGTDTRFSAGIRLFHRDATDPNAWRESTPIGAPGREDGREGFFGADIAIAPGGNRLAVADTAQQSDAGFGTFVFLFERSDPGGAWTRIRTFGNEELPSAYSAMLELGEDTLVVTPMAARETTHVDLAVFGRDAGGEGAWGHAATMTVEVSTPPDRLLPRDVLLASGLADDTLAVGIGPSGCVDLRADPGPGPTPCAGGRAYLFQATEDSAAWEVRQVLDDPTGAATSSYGEYVALSASGDTLVAGGVVLPEDGAVHTHLEAYQRMDGSVR